MKTSQITMAAAFLLSLACRHATAQTDPSFNCAAAPGRVEQMICHSPSLAMADRDLATIFQNTEYQGGIDATALRKEEDVWLTNIRDKCMTDTCIEAAYADRKARLLDESRYAASPAAYDETKPYPAPAATFTQARQWIGKDCAALGNAGAPAPPFTAVPGFSPIIAAGYTIEPVAIGGTRFAFLMNTAVPCKIVDLVTLPPASVADSFLECFPAPESDLASSGIGMRKSGVPGNVAYWDIVAGKLSREPLGVLGLDRSGLHCQQPETGE